MSDRKRQPVKPLRAADLAHKRRQAGQDAAVVEVPPAAPALPTAPAVPQEKKTSSFTARLDFDTLDAFDGLVRMSRRKLGRQVTKLDVLTALVALAADDAALRDQMIAEVGRRTA